MGEVVGVVKLPGRKRKLDLAAVAPKLGEAERALEAAESELVAAKEHEREVRESAVRVALGEMTSAEHQAASKEATERVENATRAVQTAAEALAGLRALAIEAARERGAERVGRAEAKLAEAKQREYDARLALAWEVEKREDAEAAVERERKAGQRLVAHWDPDARPARRAGSGRVGWAANQILKGAPKTPILEMVEPDERARVEQLVAERRAEYRETADERALRSAEATGAGLILGGEVVLEPKRD